MSDTAPVQQSEFLVADGVKRTVATFLMRSGCVVYRLPVAFPPL